MKGWDLELHWISLQEDDYFMGMMGEEEEEEGGEKGGFVYRELEPKVGWG
jgi:hypothetical protein